jgi:hypothetical protein
MSDSREPQARTRDSFASSAQSVFCNPVSREQHCARFYSEMPISGAVSVNLLRLYFLIRVSAHCTLRPSRCLSSTMSCRYQKHRTISTSFSMKLHELLNTSTKWLRVCNGARRFTREYRITLRTSTLERVTGRAAIVKLYGNTTFVRSLLVDCVTKQVICTCW